MKRNCQKIVDTASWKLYLLGMIDTKSSSFRRCWTFCTFAHAVCMILCLRDQRLHSFYRPIPVLFRDQTPLQINLPSLIPVFDEFRIKELLFRFKCLNGGRIAAWVGWFQSFDGCCRWLNRRNHLFFLVVTGVGILAQQVHRQGWGVVVVFVW